MTPTQAIAALRAFRDAMGEHAFMYGNAEGVEVALSVLASLVPAEEAGMAEGVRTVGQCVCREGGSEVYGGPQPHCQVHGVEVFDHPFPAEVQPAVVQCPYDRLYGCTLGSTHGLGCPNRDATPIPVSSPPQPQKHCGTCGAVGEHHSYWCGGEQLRSKERAQSWHEGHSQGLREGREEAAKGFRAPDGYVKNAPAEAATVAALRARIEALETERAALLASSDEMTVEHFQSYMKRLLELLQDRDAAHAKGLAAGREEGAAARAAYEKRAKDAAEIGDLALAEARSERDEMRVNRDAERKQHLAARESAEQWSKRAVEAEREVAHWKANHADELRKKRVASGLLSKTIQERDHWKNMADEQFKAIRHDERELAALRSRPAPSLHPLLAKLIATVHPSRIVVLNDLHRSREEWRAAGCPHLSAAEESVGDARLDALERRVSRLERGAQ